MRTRHLNLAAALAAFAALAAVPSGADDRQLLRSGSGEPLVMVLFDTSGSMNWAPKCTAEQVATGICTYLCPDGDCPVPRDGDDPASKFRQSKEALYEVIRPLTGINWGFATFNQDHLAVQWKQWLYRLDATQPDGFFSLAGGAAFPVAGTDEVFGESFACNRGGTDGGFGCSSGSPSDLNDLWEMTKIRRLPKLGDALGTTVSYYVRTGGSTYYVETRNPPSVTQALGDPSLRLRIAVSRCLDPSDGCDRNAERTTPVVKDFVYTRIGDFVKWDLGASRSSQEGGYDGVARSLSGSTCAGWDPNQDLIEDKYCGHTVSGGRINFDTCDEETGYSLRFPNGAQLYDHTPDTSQNWRFQVGDVIPMMWNTDNRARLLDRLAPRLNGGDPATDPEAFAVATYLENHRAGTNTYLRLRDANPSTPEYEESDDRPIFPTGSTPLGYALGSLRTWFRGCLNGSCPSDTGWDDVASSVDADWTCRRKYLVVLTDGDDTCPGRDPCSLTASMRSLDDITTYVVAFGVENTPGNKLNCMAANGGSGDPIYPQNKEELVEALTEIFAEIKEEAVAFASAAVPSVQANIADKIYLSSFTPLNEASVWPGRMDAFLKPLPLDEQNLPNRAVLCAQGTVEANCFAWDAGDSQLGWSDDGSGIYQPRGLLLQAPVAADITRFDNSTLDVGTGGDERRVYFGVPGSTAAGKRQLFVYPENAAEQVEFEYVWNLPNPGVFDATNRNVIADVIEFTLAEKQGQATDPESGVTTNLQYVMGDIFHANPIVVNAPSDFDFYTKDLYWNTALCGDSLEETRARGNQISYAWFSNKNLCRRVMLAAGSNDGQLHVFDAGIFRGSECQLDLPANLRSRDSTLADDGPVTGDYDFGSGRELFSFIPSAMMPLVKELSEVDALTTQYGVDNTPRVADVFIDPVPNTLGAPDCDERQWRTVLLGSYREGGPGLFALDVTQPDVVDNSTNIPTPLPGSPAYVPSCANGGINCGPLPFPSLLWEFRDTSDEDGIGGPDLGESWSRPVVARIRVCDGACDTAAEPEDRFVAVFGGGLPETPTNSLSDVQGNWLYMVDIETGRIIYKRGGTAIQGAVAADVALLDSNVNGLFESLYFGTTAGFVYKLDLGEGPFELGTDGRIQDPTGQAGRFTPFKVFDTEQRPIYQEINLVYVAKLRRYALLFGTGNRWDLWENNNTTGRFYAIVDTGWRDGVEGGVYDGLIDDVCGPCSQPILAASLQPIDPDSAFDIEEPGPAYLYGNANPDLLAGWYFPLGANEKLITEPFTLSGVTFFTMYDPIRSASEEVCSLGGESKIFIVNAAHAGGYVPAGDTWERYAAVPIFTTQPYTETSQTQNPGGGGGGGGGGPLPGPPPCNEALEPITRELKELLPATCRFANYTIDIKTIRSDTGILCIAPVPVCIEGHNWKEF